MSAELRVDGPQVQQRWGAPGKVIAVHVNYASRARERGRVPEHPSYFLKAPTSVSASGQPIVRPRGCELLGFEGEIVLVIGRRARRVSPGEAWDHVAAVTAGNDAGVYDLRYADAGSNLRSKSGDGFTPVGPRYLDARSVDPAELHITTWVNGVVVQDAGADEFLFPLAQIVADLSRLSTLEPGDLILTGTPAGASVVSPGDVVEVEVTAGPLSTGRLVNEVVEGDHELDPWGAMPRQDPSVRAAAFGGAPARPALDDDLRRRLSRVSTATLASLLRKRGQSHVTIDGVAPVTPGMRMVGTARTLRYLPLREDQFALKGGGFNAQKRAVDSIAPGEILVMDARQQSQAGTIGDILALRAQVRGAAGVVTDGAVRDRDALADLGLPVFAAAAHPAVLGRVHVPWDLDVPIACGNVLVEPGDVVVGDGDGVVVIAPQLVPALLADAEQQELEELFIAEQVAAGASVDGLYPIGPSWRDRFDSWRAQHEGDR
ncbi:MAG: 5-oxopent-3-ene,2,5-tricarboxylate decarboxylase / 2-hydroxyhepta-2,4-diene,7-dioate isomerase [Cryptosporangiaceae bacterium]|nr:5-oxopent-3-ene,2,5-tricarboxylate decarboxylase / 2-hydroxyhepta-2,4-diene,7-dioate isomerase [Cryptosporangiaceae bacterium]